jgi:hypothetical protein
MLTFLARALMSPTLSVLSFCARQNPSGSTYNKWVVLYAHRREKNEPSFWIMPATVKGTDYRTMKETGPSTDLTKYRLPWKPVPASVLNVSELSVVVRRHAVSVDISLKSKVGKSLNGMAISRESTLRLFSGHENSKILKLALLLS